MPSAVFPLSVPIHQLTASYECCLLKKSNISFCLAPLYCNTAAPVVFLTQDPPISFGWQPWTCTVRAPTVFPRSRTKCRKQALLRQTVQWLGLIFHPRMLSATHRSCCAGLWVVHHGSSSGIQTSAFSSENKDKLSKIISEFYTKLLYLQ